MKKLLVLVFVLVVAVGALGYWRGWFSVTREGEVDIQGNPAKLKQDKEAFSRTVSEKAKALKAQVTSLLKQSEGLTGDDKAHAQKELGELQQKHDRLEQQIKSLEDADPNRFESIKEDLSKNLEEVEKQITALTNKLEKGKNK